MNPTFDCNIRENNKKLNQIIRTILIIAGTISLVLGIVGIFLPILPTTPFLLLSAACYARGSDRFYSWLLCNKFVGNYIKNYRDGMGVALRIKIITLSFLWATILISALFVVSNISIRIILIIIAIGVTLHIATIKTMKEEKLKA